MGIHREAVERVAVKQAVVVRFGTAGARAGEQVGERRGRRTLLVVDVAAALVGADEAVTGGEQREQQGVAVVVAALRIAGPAWTREWMPVRPLVAPREAGLAETAADDHPGRCAGVVHQGAHGHAATTGTATTAQFVEYRVEQAAEGVGRQPGGVVAAPGQAGQAMVQQAVARLLLVGIAVGEEGVDQVLDPRAPGGE